MEYNRPGGWSEMSVCGLHARAEVWALHKVPVSSALFWKRTQSRRDNISNG